MYLFFCRGGIARYTLELLRELSARPELWMELVCESAFDLPRQLTYSIWPELYSLGHRFALLRRSRFMAGQCVNPVRLCHRAAKVGYQIVHFSDFNHVTYPLWARAVRTNGRKVVATVHDVTRAKCLLNRRYEDSQLRRFYRDADALFVHSRAQAAELVTWAAVDPQRVHVVPMGGTDYGRPSADKQQLRLRHGIPAGKLAGLSFGNLRDDKNLDLLLSALVSTRRDVHLVVAGREAARGHKPFDHYRRLCQELGILESVTFMSGYLSDQQVADLFTMCDFVVLPYSSRFTSQSGVIGVAAQYRRPVLASSTVTFRELLSDHDIGLLIEPDNGQSLEAGLAQMARLIQANHPFRFDEYLRANSWHVNAEITSRVYARLSDGGNGSS
ncbi:glycosyltransferase family 4 protein [Fontivita pretiosa]|uniref:glycosyltransferase family 4 protein n=1 Tax=Fontivita pretiosa TaxID=2989684 RepID=UPI003D16680C